MSTQSNTVKFRYLAAGRAETLDSVGGVQKVITPDEWQLHEFFDDVAPAFDAASDYVYCYGGWENCADCDGKPFEIFLNEGCGAVEHRVAIVERYGLAVDPDDPGDEGEWLPCDERGRFAFDEGFEGSSIVVYDGMPYRIYAALQRAKAGARAHDRYDAECCDDVVGLIGWRGDEGWYAFLQQDPVEKAVCWVENRAEFVEAVNSLASDFRGVDFYGDHCFPNADIDITDGFEFDDADYKLWAFIRIVVGRMNDHEIESLLTEIDNWLVTHDWDSFGLCDDLYEATDIDPETEVVYEEDVLRIASALKNLLAR